MTDEDLIGLPFLPRVPAGKAAAGDGDDGRGVVPGDDGAVRNDGGGGEPGGVEGPARCTV